jgi:hypothetical protein
MSVVQINKIYKLMDITDTFDKVPVGVYTLDYDPRNNEYYLTRQSDFILPSKIYGTNTDIINRWKKSYEVNSDKNMGIILSGIKGGGKTITAQKFCIEMNKPVILINTPYEGSDFISFLVNPKIGECIIFIDEFEKIYNHDHYSSRDLLALMDGTYQTKLIFLLTVNTYNLGDYFVNRLNRIKYRQDFNDLNTDTMTEVINDMLINKDHTESIHEFFKMINMCTFDLLVNLIKEMNLFNEDALTVGKYLNLRSEPKKYMVYEESGGKDYECRDIIMTPSDKELIISREDTNYLPDSMEDDYYLTVKLSDAEIIKLDNASFILKHHDFKFKFFEITTTNLFI